MNQEPINRSNSHQNHNSGNGVGPLEPALQSSEATDLSQENSTETQMRATQRSFARLYFVLLAIGLVIGIGLSVGVATLINHFGLADPPTPINRLQK